jgi:hypothetical protein
VVYDLEEGGVFVLMFCFCGMMLGQPVPAVRHEALL